MLRVMVQSHLGWPWESWHTPETTFGVVVDEFAKADGWHPSCYRLHVGDNPVTRSMKLSDVTDGSAGLVLCHVTTPRDSAAQRIREHMRVVATQVQEDMTKGAFFRHFLFPKKLPQSFWVLHMAVICTSRVLTLLPLARPCLWDCFITCAAPGLRKPWSVTARSWKPVGRPSPAARMSPHGRRGRLSCRSTWRPCARLSCLRSHVLTRESWLPFRKAPCSAWLILQLRRAAPKDKTLQDTWHGLSGLPVEWNHKKYYSWT